MKASFLVAAVTLLTAIQVNSAYAQAFVNDNDGLRDVGETSGFPNDPATATGALNLSRRLIQDLDGTSLLSNLQELRLRDNQITSIEAGDFNGMSNLETLDLYGNRIAGIETGGFNGLTNLTFLSLSENPMEMLRSGTFRDLESLQTLLLFYTPITDIESGALSDLKSLQTLAMNPLMESVELGDFGGLTNLEVLVLQNGRVATIEARAFSDLANLTELNLFNNDITTIDSFAFEGLSNLRDLQLGWNEIMEIETGAFKGMSELRNLHLYRNNLAVLNFSEATFSNLSLLSLEDTPIISLRLDRAEITRDSWETILSGTTGIVDASLVDLVFTDGMPTDLQALLSLPSLDNVRTDPALYHLYADEWNAFAALAGNKVVVVPEPSSLLLICLACALSRSRLPHPLRHSLNIRPATVTMVKHTEYRERTGFSPCARDDAPEVPTAFRQTALVGPPPAFCCVPNA